MQGILATQYSQQAKPTDSTNLRGLAASAGQYTGPARIIMSESEFGKLQAGDVLVCPTTQPPWSVLFPILAVRPASFRHSISEAQIGRSFS